MDRLINSSLYHRSLNVCCDNHIRGLTMQHFELPVGQLVTPHDRMSFTTAESWKSQSGSGEFDLVEAIRQVKSNSSCGHKLGYAVHSARQELFNMESDYFSRLLTLPDRPQIPAMKQREDYLLWFSSYNKSQCLAVQAHKSHLAKHFRAENVIG